MLNEDIMVVATILKAMAGIIRAARVLHIKADIIETLPATTDMVYILLAGAGGKLNAFLYVMEEVHVRIIMVLCIGNIHTGGNKFNKF